MVPGTVILANRTGTPDDEAAEAISRMEERGTNVLSASLDVSDVAAVERLIAEFATADHPLRGIVHGAAVIEDAFISQIDGGKLDRVITPKVAGTINLHNAALRHEIDLDFFLNMSSIAEMVGLIRADKLYSRKFVAQCNVDVPKKSRSCCRFRGVAPSRKRICLSF